MTRKPADETWESFTERRIREAEASGAFEDLPGFGRPIPGLDEPLDENWWVKRKLRAERVNALPPVLEARLDLERTLTRIEDLKSEAAVRRELVALNERIRRAHFSHVAGPADGILPVDVEATIADWSSRRRSDESIIRPPTA